MLLTALLLAVLSCLPASAKDIPDISATPHQLRTMTPEQLTRLLFEKSVPDFTEAWVQGPTLKFDAITVDLATKPRGTGYAGLCQIDASNAFFTWSAGARGEDVPVHLSGGRDVYKKFLLTSNEPSLELRKPMGECSELSPVFSPYMTPNRISVFYIQDSNPLLHDRIDAARFGLSVLMAARVKAHHWQVTAERCVSGYIDIPAGCSDPGAFVRSFYLRQVRTIIVEKCPDASNLCVDAAISPLQGTGENHIVVATGNRKEPHNTASEPEIKSIIFRAGANPVP